jgi:class 3 adenylate cyclase
VSETKKKKEVDLSRVPDIERWADHSLISYLKIIASLNRSKEILKYRSEPRLTLSGAQEFKVRMGFGLHAGWAIEGAVGSLQKVDATYLSPHVNMAARLETASKQYGVAVLISQNVYELMSDEAKELCRRIDKVTVKGSTVPIDIYTYDCWQDQAFKEERKKNSMDFKHAGTKYYVIGTR